MAYPLNTFSDALAGATINGPAGDDTGQAPEAAATGGGHEIEDQISQNIFLEDVPDHVVADFKAKGAIALLLGHEVPLIREGIDSEVLPYCRAEKSTDDLAKITDPFKLMLELLDTVPPVDSRTRALIERVADQGVMGALLQGVLHDVPPPPPREKAPRRRHPKPAFRPVLPSILDIAASLEGETGETGAASKAAADQASKDEDHGQ